MLPKSLGKKGEQLARKYLQKLRYSFVDQNYRTNFGEIDLIFKDKKTLVFVEVKTRYSNKYGNPEDSVTPKKIAVISRVAESFCMLNPKLPKRLRIDVIAIDMDNNGNVKDIRHIKNVTG